MKSVLLVCVFISFGFILHAQDLKSFIPNGYTLLDSVSGDLNKDGIKDLVLILKNDTEIELSDTTRPLLILHGNKNKSYTLVARNDHVVLCQACGGVFGDPYNNVVAKNNFFSVLYCGLFTKKSLSKSSNIFFSSLTFIETLETISVTTNLFVVKFSI